jgi:hypothetical protein
MNKNNIKSIEITKTKVSINKDEFKNELITLAKRLKEHVPSQIGITLIVLKKELGLKLSPLQFAELTNELGFNLYLGNSILIKDLLK